MKEYFELGNSLNEIWWIGKDEHVKLLEIAEDTSQKEEEQPKEEARGEFQEFHNILEKYIVKIEGEKNHKKGGLNCVFGNFFFYVLGNCPQVQSLK